VRSLTSFCSFAILATLCSGALCIAPTPALAQHAGLAEYVSPQTQQYLKVRKSYPPQTGLTLASLAQNPAAYRGKMLEIDGQLNGICSADEGLTRLMLTTKNFGALSLTMSRLPDWIQSGERLRVLVLVTGSDEPDTVEYGVPEMEVVAVASAGELAVMEQRARQKKDAAIAAANARRDALAAARARRAASSLASRSSYASYRGSNVASYTVPGEGLSSTAQQAFPAYRDFIWSRNNHLTEQQANDITWAILRYSEQLDTDPRLVVALIIAESDFDPRSTSHAGAMGLGQLMPDEVQDISAKTGGLMNPYDPVQNIAGSIWLLRTHLAKYSGGKAMSDLSWQHISLALAAYNAGPGAVKKYGGIPPYRETQNYVRKIAAIYKQLCGKAG